MDSKSGRTVSRGSRQFQLLRGGKTRTEGRKMDYYDYHLLAAVVLLTSFGLVMLYSVSAYASYVQFNENDMYFFERQAIIAVIAFALLLVFSRVDYHILTQFSPAIYTLACGLLFATRFIGRTVNGARRWIFIGPISFQPAEFAKLAIIIFIPSVIISKGRNFKTWAEAGKVGLYGLAASLLTYLFTDNLSTAIIIAGITFVLIFVSHPEMNLQRMFLLVIAGFILIIALYFILKLLVSADAESGRFRLQRIVTWLYPEENSAEGGYQVMQALYAIGSGGLFGKGLGNSAQKLGALPEAQNDMIFSIICEELGIVGAMIVMLLFVFVLYRLFCIAVNAPDLLGSLITVGIFAHISLQVILNIAVVLNVIPTTGITLPFVSYGGTSIVFLMAEMALALSVSGQIEGR